MTTETKSAFARRLGVDRSNVTRWAQEGRVVVVGGRIEIEASLARLEATKDPNRDDVRLRHAQARDARRMASPPPMPIPPTENAASGPQDAPDDGEQGDPSPTGADATSEAYRRFRAVKEHYQARHAKMRVAMKQGRLAPMADVRRAGEHGGAGVRGMLENLADQIAPRCAPVRDPARAGDILGRLLDGVLAQHDAWLAKTAAALRKVGAGETASLPEGEV